MSRRQPFFPKDKPRSWIIGVSAVLAGLGFGCLGFLGVFLDWSPLFYLGGALFVLCWLVGFPMIVLFNIRLVAGHYRGLGNTSWEQRPW